MTFIRGRIFASDLEAAWEELVSKNAPVFGVRKGTVDLRVLTREQRVELLEGPMVIVKRNGIPVAEVPKRALIAASEWGNKEILERPTAKNISAPPLAALVDFNALKHVLSWLSDQYLGRDNYKPRPIPMGNNAVQACQILHAATVLGMKTYAMHIVAYMHQYIRDPDYTMEYTELNALLAAINPDDSLFKHLAKDFAYRRYNDLIPDPEFFSEFLEGHPIFSQAMNDIDKEHEGSRKAHEQRLEMANAERLRLQHNRALDYQARVQDEKAKAERQRQANVERLRQAHAERKARKLQEEKARAEKREQEVQAAFMEQLRQARGGRAGGYGMGV